MLIQLFMWMKTNSEQSNFIFDIMMAGLKSGTLQTRK